MGYSKKQVFEQNLSALRIALYYQENEIIPTSHDIIALSNYKGFGGLREVLFSPTDNFGSNEDMRKYVVELHEILDLVPNKKKQYLDSIKKSTLTAFYTPKKLIEIIGQNIKTALGNSCYA